MPDIPGNSSTTSVITVDGPPVNDVLEFKGDHDWVRITLTAGQKVVISVDGITLEDSYVRVRDSFGNQLAENDDISSGTVRDSRLVFTAPSSGTYYIDVSAYNDDYTGTYSLTVETYTPPPVASLSTIATHLTNGYWGGDLHRFAASQGGTITYDFHSATDANGVTAAGQALAIEALALWSDLIGVTFVPVASGGQITFIDNEEGAHASAVYSGGITSSATVNVSTQWLTTYGTTLSSYSFQTYVHEIGHALGLGHGGFYNGSGDYDTDALFANDSWSTTIMSYFDQQENSYFASQGFTRAFAVSPMVADIRAIGTLYGLSTTTRSGDTTYGFNNNSGRAIYTSTFGTVTAYTIFDSGGIDTLDYGQYNSNQLINLNPETFSNIGGATGNVSIAFNTVIENAIGGSGNDRIIGNGANNALTGGAGVDTLTGGSGNDSFRDTAAGLSGDTITDFATGDIIHITNATLGSFTFNLSGSLLTFTGGSLTLTGGVSGTLVASTATGGGVQLAIQTVAGPINGTTGDDTLNGTAGNDTINGLDGNDTINGAAGNDLIDGGTGNDTLTGGTGIDTLTGGTGNDSFRDTAAGLSGDTITDFAVGDTIVVSDATLAGFAFSLSGNTLTYTGGSLILTGGVSGTLVASAATGGGVQLAIQTVAGPINGTTGDDTLNGTAGNDTINGLDGNDTINGAAGNDLIDGGTGNDTLTGGTGIDTLTGGSGNDSFRDTAAGLSGDTITDFAVGDTIVVSDATLAGFAFSLSGNTLTYTGGSLTLTGGVSGTLVASAATGGGVQLAIQTVAGPINGTPGDDTLNGTTGNDTINGLDGNDTINGAAGNDLIDGGTGNDTLTGGTGIDTLTGGSGNDTFRDTAAGLSGDTITDFAVGDRILITNASFASFTFSLSGNTLTYTGGSLTLASGVSGTLVASAAGNGGLRGSGVQLTIQAAAGTINGTAGDDTLTGTGAGEAINGLGGNDILTGGAGADTLTGGTGNDSFRDTAAGLSGDTITDFVVGDTIVVSDATLAGFAFSLSGNTLTYTGGSLILTGGVSGTLVASTATGGGVQLAIQTVAGPINGTTGDDTLNGTAGNDTINGLDGNDTINGAAGNDLIDGGTGNDTLTGGTGIDTLTGGTGNDSFRDTAAGLSGDTITDFVVGDTIVISDATLAGFAFSLSGNTLTYTGGSLILTGGVSGTLVASAATGGGVQLAIQTVAGPINGTTGDDTLNGTAGNDTINGLDGNDTLNGAAGNDLIDGGTGNDTLTGGTGIDTLTGGTGNDSFRDTAAGLSGDTITDFVVGDTIVISDATLAGFAFSLSGNTLTYTGGSLILTGGVSGTLVASAATGGGVQLAIQTVAGPINGTTGDDTLNGTAGNDTINGLDGNDTLNGAAGNDLIDGGTGNDTLTGGTGIDTLTGGTGNDTFRDTAAGLSGDTITDFAVGDTIVVSDATLAGFAFSLSGNTLTYTGGSLTLTGGVSGTLVASAATGGGVQLAIQTASQTINGTAGNDRLIGTAGSDTINGFDGNDVINSGGGNDILNGGAGSDTLTGGLGIDTLSGGAGNDTFRDTAAGLSGDTITDFATGDSILITDATLSSFSFSLSGNTLTYSGGSLTLTGVVGTITATTGPNTGVLLTIQAASASTSSMAASDPLAPVSAEKANGNADAGASVAWDDGNHFLYQGSTDFDFQGLAGQLDMDIWDMAGTSSLDFYAPTSVYGNNFDGVADIAPQIMADSHHLATSGDFFL